MGYVPSLEMENPAAYAFALTRGYFLLDLSKTPGMGPSTMPDLAIFSHELFARSFLHTENVAYAYRHAFGEDIDPKDALILGARVMEFPEVAARIAELEEQKYQHEYSFLGPGERRSFLGQIVRTPICNIDSNSKICHSWKRTYGKDGAVLSEEYKVPDKFRALALDLKLAEAQAKQEIANSRTIHTLEDFEKHYAQAKA